MPQTSEMLTWTWLTPAINEIKSANKFLKTLLFSQQVTLPTETIELSKLTGARETAPFVRKNGEAIMVSGHGESFQNVTAPNIRIKRPFTPSDLLFNRRPGTAIMLSSGNNNSAIQNHILTDLQFMNDKIVNTEEWLCAQALQGTIQYEVEDEEVFTISYNRPSACNITLTSGRAWDNADPTAPRPLQDCHTVKRVMSDEVGLQPTDAICGLNAANALLNLAETGNLKALKSDSGVAAGTMSFVSQFNEDGVIFLGIMGSIRFWEYSRTVLHKGVATPMIRPDYVEFVSTSQMSGRVLYYAAIADMKSTQSARAIQTKRFSKSWIQEDPSALMALAASRPLPVLRRAGATVSMKVTNI